MKSLCVKRPWAHTSNLYYPPKLDVPDFFTLKHVSDSACRSPFIRSPKFWNNFLHPHKLRESEIFPQYNLIHWNLSSRSFVLPDNNINGTVHTLNSKPKIHSYKENTVIQLVEMSQNNAQSHVLLPPHSLIFYKPHT